MKRVQKLLSNLLVLAMLMSCVPTSALAEEVAEEIAETITEEYNEEEKGEEIVEEEPTEEITEVPVLEEETDLESGETLPVEDSSFADLEIDAETVVKKTLPVPEEMVCEDGTAGGLTSDELFAGYAEKVLYGMEDASTFSFGRESAGSRLTGDERKIYDALVPIFKDIASGNRASTVVTLSAYSDPAVEFTENYYDDSINPWEAIYALQNDYPYECYWMKLYPDSNLDWAFDRAGNLTKITFEIAVQPEYRSSTSFFATNLAKTGAASNAARNAKRIIAQYENCSDYDKLCGYRDAVCNLVRYDHEAAEKSPSGVGWNPWNVINTFDGDPNTNIVCGGYARSFQYLCDLGGIQCYYILGCPDPYVVAGHAWNIVTLDDKNYHCDITWIDDDQGSDYWDYLFLAGGSGSVRSGYTFVGPRGQSVTYHYDICERSNMLEDWGEEVLTLASTNYDPATAACIHSYIRQVTTTPYFDRDGVYTYTCSRCGHQYTESFHECWYRYKEVEPTCTEQGYTSVTCHCNKPFDNIDYKPALGHAAQTVPATDPTCFSTGLTTGEKCSRCDTVLKPQTKVDTVDHKYKDNICIWCGLVGGNMDGDTYWRFSENTGTLTIQGTGPMEDFTQEKWQPWYEYHEPGSITRVVLEEGVTTIGSNAFANLDSLTEVILPDSLEVVGIAAFQGCDSLTEVVLPDHVTTIETLAFGECSILESITIPYGVTTIGDAAFSDCTSLKSIYLPASVKNLGGRVFAGCTGFTSISLPYNVEILDDYLFSECTNLTEVTLPRNAKVIGDRVFDDCTALVLLELPDSITTIGDGAFSGCTNLELLELPESLETLGFYVFSGCEKLTQLTLPVGLKSMDSHALSDSGINYVEFLGDAPAIDRYAFNWVTALVVYPPDNDTWNEETMQQYGGELYWVEAGHNDDLSGFCGDQMEWEYDAESNTLTLSGIGEMYDYNSGSVMLDDPNPHPWLDVAPQIRHVVVEDGVTDIGEYAFYNCISLQNIVIPESVTSIGNHAFYRCIQLASVDLPAGLKQIEPFVFYSCDSLTDIVIPDGVTAIGNKAFSFCENLERITIPNSVSVIGGNSLCFTALKEITMPRSLTELGYWALEANHQLSKVTFTGDAPIFDDIGRSGIFKDCESNITVYYPSNLNGWTEDVRLQYGIADGFRVSWTPVTGKTNYCGGDLQWELIGTTLNITGSGNMFNFSDERPAPWAGSSTAIQKVVLSENMTTIGDNAFADCGNLTEITIHSAVQSIGSGAFANSGLEKVFFRSNPPDLAEDAFAGVTANVHYQDTLSWRGKCLDYGGTLSWINTYPVTYSIQDILNSNATTAEKLTQLKEQNQLQLEYAMALEDGETASLIAQLENSLDVSVGVRVKAGADAAISGLFGKVTGTDLVGAAANAATGKNAVDLVFDNAPDGLRPGVKYDPERTLLFSMTLEGAENPASLEVPVLITLPLPAGADTENLRILHYHDSEEVPEELNFVLSEGRVSFVVTGFSTFGVAFIAENAARVEDMEYRTLSQAIAAAGFGGKVELLRDVEEEVPVPQEVTIIKNGFTANLKIKSPLAWTETEQEYKIVAAKARIGDVGYVSLHAALAEAKSTDSIVLLEKPDVVEKIGQTVKIDLNNLITTVPVADGWQAVKRQDGLWLVRKDTLLGDLNEDGRVSDQDAVILLWHVLFPELQITDDYVDFDDSGAVHVEDAQYLLWHTLFPELFPLN